MLDEKAEASDAASDPETQEKLLTIMGIIEEVTLPGVELDFKVSDIYM